MNIHFNYSLLSLLQIFITYHHKLKSCKHFNYIGLQDFKKGINDGNLLISSKINFTKKIIFPLYIITKFESIREDRNLSKNPIYFQFFGIFSNMKSVLIDPGKFQKNNTIEVFMQRFPRSSLLKLQSRSANVVCNTAFNEKECAKVTLPHVVFR